jgi:hypothetical protein
MTSEEAYALAKAQVAAKRKAERSHSERPVKKMRRRNVRADWFTHYAKVKGWSHYERHVHVRLTFFGLSKTVKLWKCAPERFYRLGRYIAADVKPINDVWPAWVHKLRADFLSRNV